MEKILTISIAAYNVESFISKTLNSFICDKKIMDLFEVIIVNDGSKDKTSSISKRYTDKFPNTFILIDKENGGYGSTINTSLSIAKGKYFKLVDGDDWVDTTQFVEFLNKLKIETADMVLTKYYKFNEKDGRTEVVTGDMEYSETIITNIDNYIFSHSMSNAQIAYKTEMLRNINLHITEKCFYTDFEFVIKSLPYVNTLNTYNLCVYVYRMGREGQSVQRSSWFNNINQGILVTLNLTEYYEKIKNSIVSLKMKIYMRDAISGSALNKYKILSQMPLEMKPDEKIKEYDFKLKNLSKEIYKSVLYVSSAKWKLPIIMMRCSNFILFKPFNLVIRILQKILL